MIQNTTTFIPTLLRQALLFGAMLCSLFGAPLASAQNETPTATVQSVVDNILAILRKPDFNLDTERDALRAEINKGFDSMAMAQSVLSTNWRDATPEQQTEFHDLLLDIIENTYIGRIQAYTDETVEVLGEDINGTRATVNTHIVTDNGKVPVNYNLRQRSDGWFVYDVEIENISMISSYRETYRSAVRRSGMDGLLEQMRTRLAELGA